MTTGSMTSILPSYPVLKPVRPLPSTTVLLLRDRAQGMEVLMVRRSRSAVFGGMFVFPGGMVDPVDLGPLAREATRGEHTEDIGWEAAGLRETAEEVGIYLTDRSVESRGRPLAGEDVYRWVLDRGARFDARRLRYLSNWITPRLSPQRFDARFYVARVEGDETVLLSDRELTESVWVRPARALEHVRTGKWDMILPTEKNLERLTGFADSLEAWDSIDEEREVRPVLPRMVIRDQGLDALLPGEPGYEEAE